MRSLKVSDLLPRSDCGAVVPSKPVSVRDVTVSILPLPKLIVLDIPIEPATLEWFSVRLNRCVNDIEAKALKGETT